MAMAKISFQTPQSLSSETKNLQLDLITVTKRQIYFTFTHFLTHKYFYHVIMKNLIVSLAGPMMFWSSFKKKKFYLSNSSCAGCTARFHFPYSSFNGCFSISSAEEGPIIEEPKEQTPPVFALRPEPVETGEGEAAKFLVKVGGYPRPRVTWWINGTQITTVSCGHSSYLMGLLKKQMQLKCIKN